jgi:hypothetical protein
MPSVKEYSFITPSICGGTENYRRLCAGLYLEPVPDGYAVLHIETEDLVRSSWLTDDLEYVRMLLDVQRKMQSGQLDTALFAGTALAEHKFRVRRPGWPDEWVRGTAFSRAPALI